MILYHNSRDISDSSDSNDIIKIANFIAAIYDIRFIFYNCKCISLRKLLPLNLFLIIHIKEKHIIYLDVVKEENIVNRVVQNIKIVY